MAVGIAQGRSAGAVGDLGQNQLSNRLSAQIASLETVVGERKNEIVVLNADIGRLIAVRNKTEFDVSKKLQVLEKEKLGNEEHYSKESKFLEGKLLSAKQLIKDENAVLNGVKEDITTKTIELKNIEDTLSQVSPLENTLSASIKKKEEKVSYLSSQETMLSASVSTITAEKEKLSDISKEKVEKERSLASLSEEIGSLEATKLTKQKEVDSLDSTLQEKKQEVADVEAREKSIQKETSLKLKELEDKEGDLSLRESWLAEKREVLIETKAQLEKFHGKRIANVKF